MFLFSPRICARNIQGQYFATADPGGFVCRATIKSVRRIQVDETEEKPQNRSTAANAYDQRDVWS